MEGEINYSYEYIRIAPGNIRDKASRSEVANFGIRDGRRYQNVSLSLSSCDMQVV